jgi:hypothetical protein
MTNKRLKKRWLIEKSFNFSIILVKQFRFKLTINKWFQLSEAGQMIVHQSKRLFSWIKKQRLQTRPLYKTFLNFFSSTPKSKIYIKNSQNLASIKFS